MFFCFLCVLNVGYNNVEWIVVKYWLNIKVLIFFVFGLLEILKDYVREIIFG